MAVSSVKPSGTIAVVAAILAVAGVWLWIEKKETVVRRSLSLALCLAACVWAVTPSAASADDDLKSRPAPTAATKRTAEKPSSRTPLDDNPAFNEEKQAKLTKLLLSETRAHKINKTPPKIRLQDAPAGELVVVPPATDIRADGPVTIHESAPLGRALVGNSTSTICEPSLALSKRNELLFTGNWFAAVSKDGPANLKYVSPYNTFPSDKYTFCCDQVAVYSPKFDLMIWYSQYVNRGDGNIMRVAVAGKDDMAAGRWSYYDYKPTDLGGAAWSNLWFDFPDMAVTDKFLYVTTNSFAVTGNAYGRTVALRIPLEKLAAKADAIKPDVYSATSSFSWRLTQGATDTMYFASHDFQNYGRSIEVFAWPDASADISRSTAKVTPWGEDGYFSQCPDGTAWLSGNRTDPRITAGWVRGKEVGFGWTAARGDGFAHPHVRVAIVDVTNPAIGKDPVAQPHLQNAGYAFATPAAALSLDGKTVGLTVCYGGGSKFPSQAVGVLKKEADGTYGWALGSAKEGSNGPAASMWGDYCAARSDPRYKNVFVASGWTMEGGQAITNVTPRYVRFSAGAPELVGEIPPPPPDGVKAALLGQIQLLEQKQAETTALLAALKAKVEAMPDPPTATPPAAAPKK